MQCLLNAQAGIRNAKSAEKMLKDKQCDLVGVARLLMKDPDFLNKWKAEL